ncbi:MAG: alanine--glyoxylate aminotransferase family protein [Planctomycetes bacterium]|nr:alanine--glyoxylate aminotransferase family protein [Planctomycetota bacterium]
MERTAAQPTLFIPGPTEVASEVLAEMAQPAVGHRTPECARLWETARAGLGRLMHTKEEICILTAPASAMMEAAIRNCVRERSLHLVNGAFSKRWLDIAASCGKEAIAVDAAWGTGFRGEDLRKALEEHGPVDAVTVVHNETSTGTMSPIGEYREVLADFPGTLLLVDTVSSMAGAPVLVDEWAIDVCLFGVQKCMALPAGIAIASVSATAMERSKEAQNKGWFLDFLRLSKGNQKEQSPTTPSTAHLYALVKQLERIEAEGIEARWARHQAMAERCRSWAVSHGWTMFPQEGFLSPTVSCIGRGEGPDFLPALGALKEEGLLVSNGYGDLKGKTFRIGHMGEHTLSVLDALIERFDAVLAPTNNGAAV